MSGNEYEISPAKKRKKGVKNVEYKCKRIKNTRLKNQVYVNWRGNTVKQRPHTVLIAG